MESNDCMEDDSKQCVHYAFARFKEENINKSIRNIKLFIHTSYSNWLILFYMPKYAINLLQMECIHKFMYK